MRYPLLCAGLAALAVLNTGSAAAAEWSFTYTGFHDEQQGVFLPDATLSGTFAGADANGDGMLARDEVTSLVIGGFDFVGCQSTELLSCGVQAFAYRLPDIGMAAMAGLQALTSEPLLTFNVSFDARDPEWYVGSGRTIQSGVIDYRFQRDPSQFVEQTWSWRDATLLSVTAVPEPSTWAMLSAGIALLVFGGRRRS